MSYDGEVKVEKDSREKRKNAVNEETEYDEN